MKRVPVVQELDWWQPVFSFRFMVHAPPATPEEKTAKEVIHLLLSDALLSLPFGNVQLRVLKSAISRLNLISARRYEKKGKDFLDSSLSVEFIRNGSDLVDAGICKAVTNSMRNGVVLRTFDAFLDHKAPFKIRVIIASRRFPRGLGIRFYVLLGLLSTLIPADTSNWVNETGRRLWSHLKKVSDLGSPEGISLTDAPTSIFMLSSASTASRKSARDKPTVSREGASASSGKTSKKGTGKAVKATVLGTGASISGASAKGRPSNRGLRNSDSV